MMNDRVIVRTSPDELTHFGIKGQKWGVRRYENPDGTLTPEGQKRYYGRRFEKERKKQEKLDRNADQKKQMRIAEEQREKAIKNAKVGLVGAATAGAGMLESKLTERAAFPSRTNSYVDGKYVGGYFQDADFQNWVKVGGVVDQTVGGAVALVGFGKAAYHGIRSAVASHRASIAEHTKAAQKAKAHLEGMREMFENTMYKDFIRGD